jgi:ribosomal protein S18 acetylase RimI-like enzyme
MTTIRAIAKEDIPAFREVLDSVARERKYLAMLEAPPLDAAQAFIMGIIKAGHAQFVAETDGKIVGWCDAVPGAAGTAHIANLGMGVHRDFRGRGIGRRLLETTIARVRDQGLEKIELQVYASNAAAIALYRKFGFVDEGCRKRGRLVDGVFEDVLLMALDLKKRD